MGSNGQGKTNLVEALAYLSTFTSHRVANDTALIRAGRPGEVQPASAVVRAKFMARGRERVVEVEVNRGRANRTRLNRAAVPARHVAGLIRTVVFAPEDLSIVRGEKSERRRFLDELALQLWPQYARVKAEYEQLLRQRAALLKQAGRLRRSGRMVDTTSLEVWTNSLIRAAVALMKWRQSSLDLLDSPARAAYSEISRGGKDLHLELDFSLSNQLTTVDAIDNQVITAALREDPAQVEEMYRRGFEMIQSQEIERGVNLLGPHRDDLLIDLAHLPAKAYASHGESWSVALALKLGCFQVLGIRESDEEFDPPILILDDVFAELDAARRKTLIELTQRADQVLVTAAVEADIPVGFTGQIIEVKFDPMRGSRARIRSNDNGDNHE